METLLTLPDDVLDHALSFLHGADVARLLSMCRSLRATFAPDCAAGARVWRRALATEAPCRAAPTLLSLPLAVRAAATGRIGGARAAEVAFSRAASASRVEHARWVAPPALPDCFGTNQLAREGHAMAAICGGDMWLLLGGWCSEGEGTPITNDIQSTDFGLGAAQLHTLTAAADKATQAGERWANIEAAAAPVLAAASPALTGGDPPPGAGALWFPGRISEGSENAPRQRYGHCATGAVLPMAAIAAATAVKKPTCEEARSPGGGGGGGGGSGGGGGDGGGGGGEIWATGPGSPHPLLGFQTTQASRTAALHSLLAGGAPGSPAAPPPQPLKEVVIVTGGMLSGGYSREVGDVFLLEIDIKAVAIADSDMSLRLTMVDGDNRDAGARNSNSGVDYTLWMRDRREMKKAAVEPPAKRRQATPDGGGGSGAGGAGGGGGGGKRVRTA